MSVQRTKIADQAMHKTPAANARYGHGFGALRGSLVTDLEAGYKCVIFSIKKYRTRWSAN
jgi:hypothetical protein